MSASIQGEMRNAQLESNDLLRELLAAQRPAGVTVPMSVYNNLVHIANEQSRRLEAERDRYYAQRQEARRELAAEREKGAAADDYIIRLKAWGEGLAAQVAALSKEVEASKAAELEAQQGWDKANASCHEILDTRDALRREIAALKLRLGDEA